MYAPHRIIPHSGKYFFSFSFYTVSLEWKLLERTMLERKISMSWTGSALRTDLSIFAICIMGFSRFWHQDTSLSNPHNISNDSKGEKRKRSVQIAQPVYDNGKISEGCRSCFRLFTCRQHTHLFHLDENWKLDSGASRPLTNSAPSKLDP